MAIVFYIFAFLLLSSALAVVMVRNPVYSVLYLIFCFFNAAALCILLGAEYVAMTLVIVYVGAVAVLFLFVVMMLNVDRQAIGSGFVRYLPFGILLVASIVGMMAYAYMNSASIVPHGAINRVPTIHNTKALGLQLYTDYMLAFQICGVILFVAMIGAIVLTIRHSKYVRRQSIYSQVMRRREDCVELKEVATGEGVEL